MPTMFIHLPTDLYEQLEANDTLQQQNLSAPIFVASDDDLLAAATVERLLIDNPLAHS